MTLLWLSSKTHHFTHQKVCLIQKGVPTFIIQTYTDTHTPYNPPLLHFPNRWMHYTNEKQVRGQRRGKEGEEAGARGSEILFKCSCKPSKILMLQSYLSIFKNIKGVRGRRWSVVCGLGKPGGTCTLEACMHACVCVCMCVCLRVCLPEPQNNNERQDEVSLTVRDEELLGLCPTKSFNTPANMCAHTHTHTHTETQTETVSAVKWWSGW